MNPERENAARENPLYYQCSSIHSSSWKISKHTPSTTSIRFLHRILFLHDIFRTLIFPYARIYFDKFKLVDSNVIYLFIYFIPNYSVLEFDRVERTVREWFVKERKEEATNIFRSTMSTVYRYKFLFLGTKVCQATTGTIRILLLECTSYRRNKNLLLYLGTHKFVSRSRFFKIWDGYSKSGRNSSWSTNSRYFFTRNILDEIPIHLPDATYRSLSSKFVPSNSKCIGSIHCGPTTHADKGRQYRPLRRFQLPSPIMDLLLVITVASNPSSFFLNEQYRPKIYRRISKRCDRSDERAWNLFATI